MTTTAPITVRDAENSDASIIADFNQRLALETEDKHLTDPVILSGVELALDGRLHYWVAERGPSIIGQSAISKEWSDWRCGWIWWLQSVYVVENERRRGVFRSLHTHIRTLAMECNDVIGLRLYVENDNSRAHKTYQRLGMQPAHCQVYEEIWPAQS